MNKKQINEEYFDKQSKRIAYTLAVFFADYIPTSYSDEGIIIRSAHKELVEIIRDEIESGDGTRHSIIKHPLRESYFLEIGGVPYLRARLLELGLCDDKNQREFPVYLKKQFYRPFARGFIDAKANVKLVNGRLTWIEIHFSNNDNFLMGFHEMLADNAHVGQRSPKGGGITYAHDDSRKIYNFIYSDWDYISRNGLYLAPKKERFNVDYQITPYDFSKQPRVAQARKKAEKIKMLIEKGMPVSKIINVMGYKFPPSLYHIFRSATGKSIPEYRREVLV